MTIGVLVIISVVLTLVEIWLEAMLLQGDQPMLFGLFGPLGEKHLHWMAIANDIITLIFVVELTLRFFAARSKRQYFSEFWLDIIATLPLFRVFRGARALRLLRLARLLRLLGIMSRLSSHFPHVFRRGAIEFMMICGLLLMAVVFGTVAMTYFEAPPTVKAGAANVGVQPNAISNAAPNANLNSTAAGNTANVSVPTDGHPFEMENSFWYSVYTVFAGEPIPHPPKTVWGKLVTVFLMFMGLTIFAIFAGTVSAFMVDRLRLEGRVVQLDDLHDHIVICGWTPKTETIVREYRSHQSSKATPIVIISELKKDQVEFENKRWSNVYLIHDDFTKVTALDRANIDQAKTCLVLADKTGGRSEQDADARTILAALTVEKMNRDVYTCAELINRSYSTHLELGHVNDFVVSEEYGAYMIAQAGMHRGLVGVLGELLTYQRGSEFYREQIPSSWVGQRFDDKLTEVKTGQNAILVAVHSADGQAHVNPIDYTFATGDEVVAICSGSLRLT